MNILNGDGFNKDGATKNKTLYFNMYEKNNIENYEKTTHDSGRVDGFGDPIMTYQGQIPINIRIKSSCKLDSIKVYVDGSEYVTYDLATELAKNEGRTVLSIDKPGTFADGSNSKNHLYLKRTAGTYNTTTGVPVLSDGVSQDKTKFDNLKYTFDGAILDLFSSAYLNKRNTKVKVVMTVTAPDGSHPTVDDEITIVRRDFFMLD